MSFVGAVATSAGAVGASAKVEAAFAGAARHISFLRNLQLVHGFITIHF